jgi:beta-ribofuranosylaminobenzene 5'-phosphate synthase
MEIRITTTGRLHLGFMDLSGSLGRLYGSIGVSLSTPQTTISVKTQDHLSIQHSDRNKRRKIRSLVEAFSKHFQIEPNVAIRVHQSIPEHRGLGSGTQLAMALATAMTKAYGIKASIHDLSVIMGRGMRSSIGIWSFEQGGLIIDSGKTRQEDGALAVSPPKAVFRYTFPEEWRFVVVIPERKEGLSGKQEKDAMELVNSPEKLSEEICRLVLMKLLPSFIEKKIEEFGHALSEIDRKTGMFFAPVQGGIYSEKSSYKIIEHLLASGAYGAGQSSWGPAVYGLTSKEESNSIAECMRIFLEKQEIKGRVIVASGSNKGAEVEVLDAGPGNSGQGLL